MQRIVGESKTELSTEYKRVHLHPSVVQQRKLNVVSKLVAQQSGD
jgi:hypothetical protein